MKVDFLQLKNELNQELIRILEYWKTNAVDLENGGFYGKRDHLNKLVYEAPKGLVLNARILYAFSAGYRKTRQAQYLQMAQRAFHYLSTYFFDKKNGGAYWSLDFRGKPLDSKKQVYGIAFCIYALSEYHQAMESKEALALAKEFLMVLEKKAFDSNNGGYHEAFTHDWQTIGDLRLSDKELNANKTMNTHLHILEAYSNLYRVWPNPQLKEKIIHLIGIFQQHLVSSQNHLQLFFTSNWQLLSNTISYGHDIEASWLIGEAVGLVIDEENKSPYLEMVVAIANASREGLWQDGSLLNESNLTKTEWNRERHWWQQAEAMVGYFNAWRLTGQDQWLNDMLAVWGFIKLHLLDRENGEWHWGIYENGSKMLDEDKLGFWKCPYHNVRMFLALMEQLPTNPQ